MTDNHMGGARFSIRADLISFFQTVASTRWPSAIVHLWFESTWEIKQRQCHYYQWKRNCH